MTRTSHRARLAAALAVPALLLASPAALAASGDEAGIDLTGTAGCSGTAVSFDADGGQLGFLSSKSGLAASKDAPLLVAHDGTVKYAGRSQKPIVDNAWTVSIGGITVKSGDSANAAAQKATTGTADVSDYLPVAMTGLVKVDVEIYGADEVGCTATTWVKLDGNGWTSADGLLGIAFLVLGLIGLGFSRPVAAHGSPGGVRSHGAKGAVFGALAGLGLAILLVSLAVIPFGSIWLPLAVAGGGLVVGLLFGKLMPARGGPAV